MQDLIVLRMDRQATKKVVTLEMEKELHEWTLFILQQGAAETDYAQTQTKSFKKWMSVPAHTTLIISIAETSPHN